MSILLLFGMFSLVSAAFFAARPSRRHSRFVKAMAVATFFTILAATTTDIGATLYRTAEVEEKGPPYLFHGEAVQPNAMVMQGLAESMAPCILGFTILALTAMLFAVGSRRLDEREDAR